MEVLEHDVSGCDPLASFPYLQNPLPVAIKGMVLVSVLGSHISHSLSLRYDLQQQRKYNLIE